MSATPCASIDGAAERALFEFELAGRDGVEDLDRGPGELGADPVAGKQDDVMCADSPPRYPISRSRFGRSLVADVDDLVVVGE